MSDYIPFDIQEEIMKRLPVKSLIQFRRVSKEWKSLIDSSQFIAAHSLYRHRQPHHLLVGFEYPEEELNYSSFVDDETLYQQRSFPTLPLSKNELNLTRVVGSSHGLVCLYCYDHISTSGIAVVWNPCIRKYIVVADPAKLDSDGFGVCPVTNDPKIVSVIKSSLDKPSIETKVMVYTLSSGKWRSLSTNLPTKPLRDSFCSVVTDGFIYWRAGTSTHNMIMSFDLTNESFEAIDLPDSLARHDPEGLCIRKLRESLAILQSHGNTCTVWMMEDGIQRCFTRLFTIMTPPKHVVGFRKSGVPILEVWGVENGDPGDSDDDNSDDQPLELVVYEPNLEHKNVLEISFDSFKVISYTETLLLLDRSDCISN